MFQAHAFCFIILFVIAAAYFTHRREKNRVNTVFSVLLITSLIHLIFDMITVYTVHHIGSISPKLNHFSHQVFLGTLLFMFYMVYIYLIELINSESNLIIDIKKRTAFPFFLSATGVIFLPLHYVQTEHGNYSKGPASLVIYTSIAIYALLILNLLVKYHDKLSFKKIKAIVIALMCELITAIYQLVFPYSLVSPLGILLLNLGFYMTVENPDAVLVEQLKAETARADAANNAKTQFLASISHEIRTPINAVLGMNEMILRESREKEVVSYASEVKRAAKSLLNIINDLLDITKIEAGKLTVIPVEYSLASLINDIRTMFELKAAEKRLKFKIEIIGGLPSTVIGDDVRVKQVLINILNNAIKYTENGSVTLTVSAPQAGSISFCIKDTGIGIKPEDIEKLYTPFQRVDEKRNRNIEGTGLGLSITMQLLELMNSRIDVQSVYGEGSTFSFVLPQPTANATPLNTAVLFSAEPVSEKQYKVSHQAPDAKLLIVDDSEMNRRVISGLLKETKIQIFESESGEDCLKKTADCHFDLILMDHMMPGMDGIETLRAMRSRENDPCRTTPVVIVTANAVVGAKEAYLEAGFDDFLSKPIDPHKLEKMVFAKLDSTLITDAPADSVSTEQPPERELPVIEGIDWSWANIHFPSQSFLLDTVKLFVSRIKPEADALTRCFEQIDGNDSFESYRTQVHSMKTSASTLGIVPLAGLAATLENAARAENSAVISTLHPVFIEKWLNYAAPLKQLIPTVDSLSAAEHSDTVFEILDAVRAAAAEMDVDALDELSAKLDGFSFEEPQAASIEELKTDIINFNIEKLMTFDYLPHP